MVLELLSHRDVEQDIFQQQVKASAPSVPQVSIVQETLKTRSNVSSDLMQKSQEWIIACHAQLE